jgi:hypothetical protein
VREAFGVCVNSLSSVQHYLSTQLGEQHVAVLRQEWKPSHSRAKVILLTGVNTLKNKALKAKLDKHKGVALIFDSPTSLYNIPKLKWLDVKRGENSLSYKFEFVPLDYASVFSALNAKTERTLKIKSYDILASLVLERSETIFLKTLHDYMYFCTSHRTRDISKLAICQCIVNKTPIKDLYATLKLQCMNDTDISYLKTLTDLLETKYGKRLQLVIRTTVNKKKNDYKSLCTKHNVQVQDARWAIKTLRLHRENIKLAEIT